MIDRKPGADGDAHVATLLQLEMHEMRAHALPEQAGDGDVVGHQHDRELLAAKSGDQRAGRTAQPQDFGERLNESVADAVTIGVVDVFEVIEIEHHERHFAAQPDGVGDQGVGLPHEAAPVEEL